MLPPQEHVPFHGSPLEQCILLTCDFLDGRTAGAEAGCHTCSCSCFTSAAACLMASEVDTLAAESPGSKAVSAAFDRADWLPTNADSFDVAANCHCCSCRGSVQALRVLAEALACWACAQRLDLVYLPCAISAGLE